MSEERHGLSIGIERWGTDIFLTMKATGKLRHEDYETLTPMIDSALSMVREPNVRVLLDATELEGWEARAAWDDFRLMLRHGNDFNKVAIYGNRRWQEITSKLGSWFVSGDVKFFDNREEAVRWLTT